MRSSASNNQVLIVNWCSQLVWRRRDIYFIKSFRCHFELIYQCYSFWLSQWANIFHVSVLITNPLLWFVLLSNFLASAICNVIKYNESEVGNNVNMFTEKFHLMYFTHTLYNILFYGNFDVVCPCMFTLSVCCSPFGVQQRVLGFCVLSLLFW